MPKPIPYKHGFRVNFTHNGTKYRNKFRTRSAAQIFIDKVMRRPPKVMSTLEKQIQDYIDWSKYSKKKSHSTIQSLSHNLTFFQEVITATSAQQIKMEHMRRFRDYWLKTRSHLSDKTWDGYRQSISSFLNWMNKRDPDVINVAIDDEFKVKVQDNPPQTFEKEERDQIIKYIETINKDQAFAIRFLFYTGIRLGELVELKWSDIKLNRQSFTCGYKTKKTRTVPIAKTLLKHLKKRDVSVYLLDDGLGNKLQHRKTYYTVLQKACYVLGLNPRPIHAIRHSFIRYLLEAGTPINEVAKIAGHSDIRTTMKYAQHFSIERAINAVDKI